VRVLAIALVLAAVGSFVVSIASHEQRAEWTMYTPPTAADEHDGVAPIDSIGTTLGVSTPEIELAETYDEYDHMPWDDARLWLGLAIGFAVSAAGVGAVALRRRA
jgi:hypothetical protein